MKPAAALFLLKPITINPVQFESLYVKHAAVVYGMMLRGTNGDIPRAELLTCETFKKLLHAIPEQANDEPINFSCILSMVIRVVQLHQLNISNIFSSMNVATVADKLPKMRVSEQINTQKY